MSLPEDRELVRRLMAAGLVTKEQVRECLEVQQATGGLFSLREVLEKKGLLSGEEARSPGDLPAEGALAGGAAHPPGEGPRAPKGDDAAALLGQVIGGFKLVDVLGSGAMGVVYRALQLSLHRFVAVKVLVGELARDEEFLDRFHAEARAIARVSHPNIRTVYDVGNDGECHYMAMEYVDGETVMGLMARQCPLPVAQAQDVARQAAKGLGPAHEAGLVHRDVKPDNLMIDRHGVVKVTDFGLVKHVKAESGKTMAGDVLGTPWYMAPEQGRGSAVDRRCDVYALGASLYHMLVGRPPFEASSAVGIIVAHQTLPAPDARAANREVPPGLARLVQRMMAKEPGDRPESMEAVARALEQPDLPGSGRLPTAAGAGTMAALAPRGRVRRLAGRRFLVAHRNPDERRRVMAFLQEEGARVEEAGTGPAVLNRLEGETPVDAVVMALNLPVRDGLATCHAIRAKASSREVPVLLCGTVSGRQVVLAAAKAGAAAFLTEPVDARLLVARLEKCTRVRTVVSQLLIGCFDKPRNAALRAITLRCSFHDVPTPFVALALRPLTQEVVPDHLDVPVYRGALEGYEPVDFPRLEMRVCPDCHYASDRDDHFAGEEGGRRAFFADRRMRSAMRECRDERRLLFEEVGEAFYSEDRDVEDAVRAYRLGVMSERTLFIASGEREGSYLAKAGDYQLRMAQFLEEQGRAGDADDARREAQGTLEAACRAMANGLELDRAQYRRLALAILFGRCDEAVEVRQAMHRRYLDAGSDAGGRVNLLRYLKRAKELLDHRDEYTREAFRVRSAAAGAAGGGA